MENFYETAKKITMETPNDTQLGARIRQLVLKTEDDKSQNINANTRKSNQIDLEDMINEVKNGD